ncbi:MAG: SpoIIE family protein phosphatase [Anaerolineae bacterium]
MTLISQLSSLESAGLIRVAQVEPDLEYLFRHALVQDAAYQSLLTSDRRRLHHAVGQVIEHLYADRLDEYAAMLARHFARAGDRERARGYYRRAADAALAAFANPEAEGLYRHALELATAAPDRAALLGQLGEALVRQGLFEEGLDTWRQAIALCRSAGNLDGVAHFYARSARAAWYAGDTPLGLTLCQEGLATVEGAPESSDQARLLHEAARAYLFNGVAERAEPLLRQALAMARRQGAVGVEADALATMGILPNVPPDQVLSALRRSVALAHEHGLLEIAHRAHHNLGIMTGSLTADIRAARRQFEEAILIARKRGVVSEEVLSSMSTVGLSVNLGDLEAAAEALSRMEELIETLPDPETTRVEVEAMRAGLLGARGEWQQSVEIQRQVLKEAERRGNLQMVLNATLELAGFRLELHALGIPLEPRDDDWAETEAMLQKALQITDSGLGNRAAPRQLLSILRTFQGRLDEARTWLAEAEAHTHEYPSAWDEQTLREPRLELATAEGRWDEALTLVEAMATFEREHERRWNWARALRRWAEVYARRGEPADLERAQALLRQARGLYEEMGADRYATLTRERLETLRAETFARARAHDKVAHELAVAGRIQAGLLPEAVPALPGWQLSAVLEPARETSGDFYDFVHLAAGRLAIVVADVADKGAGAALYMALSRTLLRTALGQYPDAPARALAAANERILADTHTDMFVTLFCAILDPESGEMIYANAGHNPPYLLSAGRAEPLPPSGMALGVVADTAWQERRLLLAPGDTLLLYTDGVIDAQGIDEQAFGSERLLATALSSGRLSAAGGSAHGLQEAILTAIHHFVGAAPRFDDLTLLVLSRQ